MKAIEMLQHIEDLYLNRFKQDPAVYSDLSMLERFGLSQTTGNIEQGLTKDECCDYVMAKVDCSAEVVRATFEDLLLDGFIEGTRRYKPVAMKSNLLSSVNDMNLNFEFYDPTSKSRGSSAVEVRFLEKAAKEELAEYLDADTLGEELDALIDLTVFTLGTVVKSGYVDVFNEAFARVMVANNNKVVGPQAKRGSYKKDLIKLANWEAPEFGDLL
jgi:hypothetical protein